MSEQQHKDEETEVEGHVIEVGVTEESDDEDAVEAHVMRTSNVRME